MIKKFTYGNFNLDYILTYSDRKSMAIIVHPSMRVEVKVPNVATEDEINKFLKSKYVWMNSKLEFFKKFNLDISEKKYISGSDVLFLGKQYKLLVNSGESNSVIKDGNEIILTTTSDTTDSGNNLNILNIFYHREAEKVFKRRFRACLKLFPAEYLNSVSFKVRKMNKRWGSYQASKNNILLNLELIKADRQCIDYIIVHELCHIKHKTHNKEFYKTLSLKVPNYESIENKLELRFIGYSY